MAGIRADRKTGKPRATAPRGNRLSGWAQLKAEAEKKAEGARLQPAQGACTPAGAAGAPPTTALPEGGQWRNGETVCRSPKRATGAKNPKSHENRRATMKPQNDSAKECSSSRQMKNTRAGRRGPARNSVRQPLFEGSRGPSQLRSDGARPQTCWPMQAEKAPRDIGSLVADG